MRFLLVSTVFFCAALGDQITNELCSTPSSQQSCGQCIKSNEECAWCLDPHFTMGNRCQVKTKFVNTTCTPHLVYSPQASEVKVQQNLLLETKHHDGKTTVRLQPQATSVRLMPGHSAVVPFKYLHITGQSETPSGWETMEIQTSDVSETPLSLKFFVFCEGERKETKSCRVQNNQIVEFEIEIHVGSCSSTGDITLSVGVLGQRTIAGLYVTTVCGCECEKHPEINSRLCHEKGHLVCGECVCNQSHGGKKCECSLAEYGVQDSNSLEDKCKLNSSSTLCSGMGACKCGQCDCFQPTVTGKYCECNNDSCPASANGKICSGNGVCNCGICKCENGWDRDDCSCSNDLSNCIENGEMCSNSGKCECNRCVCNIGKIGAFCGSEEKSSESSNLKEIKEATVSDSKPSHMNDVPEQSVQEEVDLQKVSATFPLLIVLTVTSTLFFMFRN